MVACRCISGLSDSELPDAVSRMLATEPGSGNDIAPCCRGRHRAGTIKSLLEAIDWAMAVDEHDRPQTVDVMAPGTNRGRPEEESGKVL